MPPGLTPMKCILRKHLQAKLNSEPGDPKNGQRSYSVMLRPLSHCAAPTARPG